MNDFVSQNRKPWSKSWPSDGLEYLNQCPVCESKQREVIHKDLTDNVFFCAPGKWTLWKCADCESGYLDPRPNTETINLAYQRYFTHNEASNYSSLSFLGKLRRRLANGDRNYRYGTHDYPAGIIGIIGILASALMTNVRADIDAAMRHLPKVNTKNRLLDLGCGNGAFLLRARSASWDVVGVDFDPRAVKAACSQGLDVRLGGVETLDPSIDQFDIITLSHVIEHVHHPVEILQACYKLLKPGGHLWLETPNIASEGHRLFGENWRGLEPPRHLVLFTLKSMCNTLSAAGFLQVEVQAYRPLCEGIFRASQAISDGVDPYSVIRSNVPPSLVNKTERIAKRDPGCREFITVKAWKKRG